jgi:hypothetical protein
MLRRTRGDVQVYIIVKMKDKLLSSFFESAQDVLATLQQALVNLQALQEAQNQF